MLTAVELKVPTRCVYLCVRMCVYIFLVRCARGGVFLSRRQLMVREKGFEYLEILVANSRPLGECRRESWILRTWWTRWMLYWCCCCYFRCCCFCCCCYCNYTIYMHLFDFKASSLSLSFLFFILLYIKLVVLASLTPHRLDFNGTRGI